MKINMKFRLTIHLGVREDLVDGLLKGAHAFSGESTGRTTRHCYTLLSGEHWEHTRTEFGPFIRHRLRKMDVN